jgi:hypothetical protein
MIGCRHRGAVACLVTEDWQLRGGSTQSDLGLAKGRDDLRGAKFFRPGSHPLFTPFSLSLLYQTKIA